MAAKIADFDNFLIENKKNWIIFERRRKNWVFRCIIIFVQRSFISIAALSRSSAIKNIKQLLKRAADSHWIFLIKTNWKLSNICSGSVSQTCYVWSEWSKRVVTSCSQNEEHRIKHKTYSPQAVKRKEEDNNQTLQEVDLVADVCAKKIVIGIYEMAVKYVRW